jgi:hypothetical protein
MAGEAGWTQEPVLREAVLEGSLSSVTRDVVDEIKSARGISRNRRALERILSPTNPARETAVS